MKEVLTVLFSFLSSFLVCYFFRLSNFNFFPKHTSIIRRKSLPSSAGIILLVGFLSGCLASSVFYPTKLQSIFHGIILTTVIITLVGLLYDYKIISAKVHELLLILCILAFTFTSINNITFKNFKTFTLTIKLADTLYTFAWIYIVINVINFSNQLEGIAAGVSSIIMISMSTGFFIDKVSYGLNSIILFSALGSLLGILKYNYPEAEILLGNSGTNFIGFSLGIVCLLSATKRILVGGLVLPLLLIFIPIVIISLSIIFGYSRGITKKREQPDKLTLKITEKKIAVFIYNITLIINLVVLMVSFAGFNLQALLLIILLSITIFWQLFYHIFFEKSEVKTKLSRKIDLFGVKIDRVTIEDALKKIESFVKSNKPSYIVTPNSLAILQAIDNPEFKNVLCKASLSIPDGFGIIWAADFLGSPLIERVPGIDLMFEMCRLAEKKGYSIYLLGALPDVVERAAVELKVLFPDLKIAGFMHGYFTKKEEEQIINEISQLKPTFLFVAMGLVKQETWIYHNLHKLNVKVAIGIGGSFDIISGKLKRAPASFQNLGIEWLYRLFQEPSRLKRIINLPRFIVEVFKLKLLKENE